MNKKSPKKSKERLEAFKKILLDKKRKMWADLRNEYFTKLGKDYSEQFSNPQDVDDLALIDLIEDIGLKVSEVRVKELTDMDEALKKLERGSYGICDECKAEIAGTRLKVMPFACLCVNCQKKKESL